MGVVFLIFASKLKIMNQYKITSAIIFALLALVM